MTHFFSLLFVLLVVLAEQPKSVISLCELSLQLGDLETAERCARHHVAPEGAVGMVTPEERMASSYLLSRVLRQKKDYQACLQVGGAAAFLVLFCFSLLSLCLEEHSRDCDGVIVVEMIFEDEVWGKVQKCPLQAQFFADQDGDALLITTSRVPPLSWTFLILHLRPDYAQIG